MVEGFRNIDSPGAPPAGRKAMRESLCPRAAAAAVAVLSLLSLCGPVRAQEKGPAEERGRTDLERRIRELERQIEGLRAEIEAGGPGREGAVPGRAGMETAGGAGFGLLGRLGQTTGFSNTFNPAIGFTSDSLFAFNSRSDSGDDWNKFHLRSAELGISSYIDPYGWAYAVVESHMGEHVGLPEAAGNLFVGPDDWNLRLKAGKFLTDFGKINQVHDHDLPFTERPLVLEDFLGGANIGTGAELHQWFGLTEDIPIRWSLGMFNSTRGHSHAVDAVESDMDTSRSTGYRGFRDFAYGGRVTAYTELGEAWTLQVGTSALYQGEQEVFRETVPGTWRGYDLENRLTAGLDVTLKWLEATGGSSLVWGTELLRSRAHYLDDVYTPGRVYRDHAAGGYTYLLYKWNQHWSAYVMYDRHQVPGSSRLGKTIYSAGITWDLSHFNRLRLHYSYRNLEGDEDSSVVYLQWVFVIGTHAHGMDW